MSPPFSQANAPSSTTQPVSYGENSTEAVTQGSTETATEDPNPYARHPCPVTVTSIIVPSQVGQPHIQQSLQSLGNAQELWQPEKQHFRALRLLLARCSTTLEEEAVAAGQEKPRRKRAHRSLILTPADSPGSTKGLSQAPRTTCKPWSGPPTPLFPLSGEEGWPRLPTPTPLLAVPSLPVPSSCFLPETDSGGLHVATRWAAPEMLKTAAPGPTLSQWHSLAPTSVHLLTFPWCSPG